MPNVGEALLRIAIGEPAEPTMGGGWAGLTKLHVSGVQNLEVSKVKKNDGSTVVTTRVRTQDLTMAGVYFGMRGSKPQSRSEIISMCVSMVANLAQLEGDKRPDLEQAVRWLESNHPVQGRGKGNKRNWELPNVGQDHLGTLKGMVNPVSGVPYGALPMHQAPVCTVGEVPVSPLTVSQAMAMVSHDSGSQFSEQFSEQAQWEDLNSASRTGGAIPGASPSEVRYE